ncbi:MAG TPA: ABC transporter ATP-binding protein [Anaerolineae bacterium]|nr:ABC transporter ATP-binding protein [Anaerolineae bacterium]HID85741.1 ABC transporter ATP-binding protein [Anaerolineales bacterium]HIQ09569.1 ABC transporter ATP-binding protein [Anaerolineaceae bacterium]
MSTVSHASEFTPPRQYRVSHRSAERWVLSHALRYWYLFVLLFIGAFGNAALAAAVPMLVGRAFNAVVASPPQTRALLTVALWIAGTQVLRGGLQFLRNFGAEWLAQRLERDVRDELYVSLLGKSMTFHNLQSVGDIMARATNDVREVNLMFSPGINLVIGSANFLFMPLLAAPRYHPALMLTPAVFIVVYFFLVAQYLHELRPVSDQVRSAFGRMNTRLSEALDGIETVKGAAQERGEVGRFLSHAREFRDAMVRQGDIEARFFPFLLLALAQAGGLVHAMLLFRQGALDLGQVVAYFGLLQLFGFPVFVSQFAYSQVSLGLAGARRILELINKETRLDQNLAGYVAPIRGAVAFEGVTFAYEAGAPVLEGITFRVEPGMRVAVVGQTGSGKTTLVKLINRTYDVTAGRVLVDGVDVREWNLESLRSQIAIIEQDIFLFSRTVAENIAFGKPGATREEIIRAAKLAQAHEFIMGFKDGYDTVIGERGVTLSGGQRQRLALARAFLTDPRILILDDSTSAIDSATEDKIQRAIFAASRGRTTFIITHRLSQIRWADLIVVLRKGRLVAVGTHEELLQSSPIYRRIFTE